MYSPLSDKQTSESGGSPERFHPLIFGEALFDHLPDGSMVLGGAPFNVAWHLRGFKANPLLVSAVGRDREGASLLSTMGSWGLDTRGIQTRTSLPTGRVTATIHDGEPTYDIEPRQAYDFVKGEDLPTDDSLSRCHLLYHGTLASREATSATTLALLKKKLRVPLLVDVNLRAPWWEKKEVSDLLQGADCVKLNREEALLLGDSSGTSSGRLEEVAGSLRDRLEIGTLVVTLGAEGAMAFHDDGLYRQIAPAVMDAEDSVGAGDAFTAVLALGLHEGWSVPMILLRAVEFAAELCRVRGATVQDRDLYTRYSRRWALAE